jgi:hypothetical protein
MNWEESKSLTPLKRDFLRLFFNRRNDFFLTGGSALSIFYLDHRFSYDLDFFTVHKVDWHHIDNVTIDIAQVLSAKITKITTSDLFSRYELVRADEKEIIDFVVELVPQIEKTKNTFDTIIVDTANEIGINKICTLVSRSELKDVVDLYFLTKQGFDIINNIAQAQKKDAGVDPAMISFLLSQLKIHALPDYLIRGLTIEELNEFVQDLLNKLSLMAFPSISREQGAL